MYQMKVISTLAVFHLLEVQESVEIDSLLKLFVCFYLTEKPI